MNQRLNRDLIERDDGFGFNRSELICGIYMKGVEMKKELSPKQPRSKRFALQRGRLEELLKALKARFEKNLSCHKGLDWAKVQARLEANAEKLWSLHEMERTGGEP